MKIKHSNSKYLSYFDEGIANFHENVLTWSINQLGNTANANPCRMQNKNKKS